MKSILRCLYDGEIFPAKQFKVKTEEYRIIREKHHRHYQDFIETLQALDPPLHKRFIEIMDKQIDAVPLEFSAAFIDEFRLGAKIIMEVFQENNG